MPAAARSAGPDRAAAGAVTPDEFARLMAPLGPFGPAPSLLAGVSGGPHSLALALLAHEWVTRRGGKLEAVICDHQLRPESGAEADHARAMLAARGVPARVVRLDVAKGAAVQARAREARLAALLAACGEAGAPWLLLGHHRDDQAETVLLRGLAASGTAGLAGMAAVRATSDALVLRPLIGVPPGRLEAVVAAAGLTPVRDPSNADRRFDRVRARAALGDAAGSLAEAAERFAARRDAADEGVAERLAAAATLHEEGFARLDLAVFGRDLIARRALGALVRVIGGGRFAPADPALAALLARGQGTLGRAVLRSSGLLLREAAQLAGPVAARDGAGWDGRFVLSGPVPPGLMVAAARGAARRLPRQAWLPAAVAPTLPALHCEGALAAVPALAYSDPVWKNRVVFRFLPAGGTVT
jgi:tRNA(Ile)-lysidine synthase